MIPDPIVDEVRAIREQLGAQFDPDIREIVKEAQNDKRLTKLASYRSRGRTRRNSEPGSGLVVASRVGRDKV